MTGRVPSDIAFTARVKGEQERRGSRAQYQRMEEARGWASTITPDLATLIGNVRSFYLATANAEGQPYVQHRGGPKGFLNVVDEKTLGFADYGGNKQYITLGNLSENARAFIFIMDYSRRLRIKIWGTAKVIEGDDDLLRRMSEVTSGSPERVIKFTVEAWDRNCPQHIPVLFPQEDVERALTSLQSRIDSLEAENARLRNIA